mgnify:CR=1 FL=1
MTATPPLSVPTCDSSTKMWCHLAWQSASTCMTTVFGLWGCAACSLFARTTKQVCAAPTRTMSSTSTPATPLPIPAHPSLCKPSPLGRRAAAPRWRAAGRQSQRPSPTAEGTCTCRNLRLCRGQGRVSCCNHGRHRVHIRSRCAVLTRLAGSDPYAACAIRQGWGGHLESRPNPCIRIDGPPTWLPAWPASWSPCD